MAAWHGLAAVPDLTRVPLVDAGLLLWLEHPPTGRLRLTDTDQPFGIGQLTDGQQPTDTDQPTDGEQPDGS